MFRDPILNPIDPIPLEYVNTLCRLDCEPDYSLTCLGIAMLKSRIENYHGIKGVWYTFSNEMHCILNFLERENSEYPDFCYYRYNKQAENDSEIKQMLADKGYEIKETIGAFLKDKADVKCIAAFHKTRNSSAIFINSNDMRFYHMIISFLPLLFPSLFASKPLETKDYDIIKSLSKSDKSAFIKRIQESVQEYIVEFRRMMLVTLLKAMHEIKITQALRDVDNARTRLNEIQANLANMVLEVKRLSAIYEGIKITESYDEPEENLVDYLASNKQIHNVSVVGNKLYFTVATLLNNYNADAWCTFSERGFIYDGRYNRGGGTTTLLEAFTSRTNRKLLLDSIFNECPEFAVKICGNYSINFDTCYLSTERGYAYENADPMYKAYIPNPHLKIYGCLGGYEDRVSRALHDRNYIGAIEMCCASAGSVNLEETEQTFRPFLGWLLNSREKILRRKDGVEMTPEEALVYLKDKEKNE